MLKYYNCPRCADTVKYDLKDGKLHCPSCRAIYEAKDFEVWNAEEKAPTVSREEIEEERRFPMIRMQIAVCNSCGAELAINDVEASSFCPYCGNASIVMDRVEERLAPDYIIPFKITKEEAEKKIRDHMKYGKYVPEEIKHFEIDRMRGIYIPFWLYDIYYGAEVTRKYKDNNDLLGRVKYDHTLSDCIFHRLTVDASRMFNDRSSQRLEPFDMSGLKPFDPVYLSGFYSDRFDVGQAEADDIATDRAREMFFGLDQKDIYTPIDTPDPDQVRTEILNRSYAFLPVWFLTFRHGDQPYTILVNGQTGKLVSAVGIDRKRATQTFLKWSAIFCLIFGVLGSLLIIGIAYLETKAMKARAPLSVTLKSKEEFSMTMALIIIELGAILIFLIKGLYTYSCLRKSIKVSRSRTNNRLANERQDKT